MALPVGSRFRPTALGLVRSYLRNMVERKQNSFITTMDLYKDEPWLLHHVTNPLFDKKEWYYFVPRSKRGGQTPNRTVPGRGGSEGGFWKSTDQKKEILDGQKMMMGFKQNLTYYQKSQHVKDGLHTDWHMTDYTLPKGSQFQALVLCHIRLKKETKDKKLGFVNHVPQPLPLPQLQVAEIRETYNMVSNQLVQEEADFADELEEMMLQAEYGDDTQQQQQEEEIPILTPVQSNENNGGVMMTYLELCELKLKMLQRKDGDDTQQQLVQEEADFADEFEALMLDRDNTQQQLVHEEADFADELEALMLDRDNAQQQLVHEKADFADELEALMLEAKDRDDTQQQEEEIQILPPLLSNNNNGVMMATRQEVHEIEVKMLQVKDGDDTQQQQQQEEEEEIPIIPPVQSNDNNGVMMAYPELHEFEAMLLQQLQQEQEIQILLDI